MINDCTAGLCQDPVEQQSHLLRTYIEDRTTLSNPRDHWASSHIIRAVAADKNGKPKSSSWFQKFKRDSSLASCPSRSSHQHGRLREWCYEDIANAWFNWQAQR